MGNCVNSSQFAGMVNTLVNNANDVSAKATVTSSQSRSGQQGGIQELILPNLTSIGPASNPNQFRYESSCYWVYFAKAGSSPGAEFSIEFTGGKSLTKFVPGAWCRIGMDGFNLTNTGVTAGVARLVLGMHEDTEYNEENIENGIGAGPAYAPTATSGQAGYNSAAGANAPSGLPSSATPALNVKGAIAARVLIRSSTPITTVTIRWWLYDSFSGAWYSSNNIETIAPAGLGSSNVVSSDMAIGVRDGYVYAELYANQNTGAAGNFAYTLEVL